MRLRHAVAVSIVLATTIHDVAAVTIGGNPGPEHNYVCPHSDGQPPLECYFDAVAHLYTMCRNVKSIEVIEFGYEKSAEGTNGLKSESCLEKQKLSIVPPYKAALKEARHSKKATEALHGLNERWQGAMTELKWREGESDDDYKSRVAKPYAEFNEHIAGIRSALTADAQPAAKDAKPRAKKRAAKPAAKAGTN